MKYVIVCCAILVACTAPAQVPGFSVGFGVQADVINFNVGNVTNTISTTGTTSITTGDFTGALKDIYGIGYGGGVHLDFKLPIISFRIAGDYIRLTPDKAKYTGLIQQALPPALAPLASQVNIDGGRIDIYSVSANLKVAVLPLPIISVYATGGVGLVRVSLAETQVSLGPVTLATFPGVETQTKPAVNAGAGVDLSLGPIALFGELKIDWIFTDPKTSTAIPYATVGLTF